MKTISLNADYRHGGGSVVRCGYRLYVLAGRTSRGAAS